MMVGSLRRCALALALTVASTFGLACAESSADSTGEPPRAGELPDASADQSAGGGGQQIVVDQDASDAPQSTMTIVPEDPVVDVTYVDGVQTSMTVGDGGGATLVFRALVDGVAKDATWLIDRGELGTFDTTTGTFTPKGTVAGSATISARSGSYIATTRVSVRIHATANGAPRLPDGGAIDAGTGAGGLGGVGGNGLGGPVDDATRALLTASTKVLPSSPTFGWLYPYDKTVWPRGILAPLLQWETDIKPKAIYIHLKEMNFEFQGFYAAPNMVNQLIEQSAWVLATGANASEYLHAEITITDGTKTYGPIAQDWLVAPGKMRGTVYYGSYNTKLATAIAGEGAAGNILSIKPGATDPDLAIPSAKGRCLVCHVISQDGSTLFVQEGKKSGADGNYYDGVAFDLKTKTQIQYYRANPNDTTMCTGPDCLTSSDGTPNQRKFAWAAPWKDGTFAFRSSTDQYGFPNGDTKVYGWGGYEPKPASLFRRDDGNRMAAAGLEGIDHVVTPIFSPDMKKVAFNYWAGTAGPGGGDGYTLDVMDVACNATSDAGAPPADAAGGDAGSASRAGAPPSCASVAFSNLRRIYKTKNDPNWYVGWPNWLPDSSGIVFHQKIISGGGMGYWAGPLLTWRGTRANLWFVTAPTDPTAPAVSVKLQNLDGDSDMNYEPTVNPIASGGYYWVVFTSRRAYGNVIVDDPDSDGSPRKKLWVAALDLHPSDGQDPSHPAFYLPGQELAAGNSRGFWVVDPCKTDGVSCEGGDECCGGFCRPAASGALVCGSTSVGCANEFEKCTANKDCCGFTTVDDPNGYLCLNGFCVANTPNVPK